MQFRPGRPIYFGSSPECEMALSDKTVSRRHLMAIWEGDTVLLRDQGSTNGTYVQGSRFKEIAIGFGAEFKLGRTVIKFLPEEEIVDPEPSEQSAFGHLIGGDTKMRQLFKLM
ncbi:MAG TPA: FHA domain-containing protein, partial [Kofleriaceae bacterium]|nr:FHA domain-containing protein [Kofleriaceae bacterium]